MKTGEDYFQEASKIKWKHEIPQEKDFLKGGTYKDGKLVFTDLELAMKFLKIVLVR